MTKLINLNSKSARKGSLIALEEETSSVPFSIKRIYYIYGVGQKDRRGYHAHKQLKQLLVCVSGKCKVDIKNSLGSKTYELNSPSKALLIEQPAWREIYDFSHDGILMVLANESYDPSDYIWDFDEFAALLKESKTDV